MLTPNHDDLLHCPAGRDGLIHHLFEIARLPPVVPDISRDDHSRLRILNTGCQRGRAEPGIHHAVDNSEAGTGEHGHDLLGNLRQVDRDEIALSQAEALQPVRAAIHLPEQFCIRKHPLLTLLPNPDHRDFISTPRFDVPVQTVRGDIARRPHKPFGPGIIPLQDSLPGAEPLKLLRGLVPKCLWIRNRLPVCSVVVLDVTRGFRFSGWGNDPLHAKQTLKLFLNVIAHRSPFVCRTIQAFREFFRRGHETGRTGGPLCASARRWSRRGAPSVSRQDQHGLS